MKTVVKIIVTLLAAAGIVAAVFWGLMPPQRSSVCLWLAESSAGRGATSSAARYYEQALKINPRNADARRSAIDFYTAAGNYTKVEYHLLAGIETEPSRTEYYVELSRVYTEQGKFNDAVDLLEHIKNPVAEKRISSMRPHAPVISPESGNYRGELSVAVTAQEGMRIYCSKDGNYPVMGSLYTGAFSPEPGEIKIMAVCVDASGLVSPLSTADYRFEEETAAVRFADPGIEKIVRGILSRPEGDISSGDLRSIREFNNASGGVPVEIATLDDLRWCTDLDVLELTGVPGALNCLGYFPNLRILSLYQCDLSDLTPLSGCVKLECLDLSANRVASLQGIAGLTSLERLTLRGNSIVDLTPLGSLTSLVRLDLGANAVSNIAPLRSCDRLESLWLDSNKLSDISVLGSLTRLTELNISGNSITDIGALSACVALQTLDSSSNGIERIDALTSCPDLVSFSAKKNKVSDITPLAGLIRLNVLDLSENALQTADALGNCRSLQTLDLSKNSLNNILKLAQLQNLTEINIENNKIKDINILAGCSSLKTVYAFGNGLKDVKKLEDASITVYK